MIAIIGSEGSMGRRWCAIAAHFKMSYLPLDKAKNLSLPEIVRQASQCDRIIIATPTVTHLEYLKALLPLKKPILCEKPITKDFDELIELHNECNRQGWRYSMVMQYRELEGVPLNTHGRETSYDYYNQGKSEDGLWNVMQPIALANGPVFLNDKSPVWRCSINGVSYASNKMDQAYIQVFEKWIAGQLNQSMDQILADHKKVHDFKEKYESN